jgi:SAM-dependent methyltransferase
MTDRIAEQYELYPYPARDPKAEGPEPITGSPSHLDELNHFVFGGRLDFARPFRALVAGGGTGDGLIMLAEHCRRAEIPAEIVYLDPSRAARAVAEARAQARGLSTVRFETGSIDDAARIAPGPYDYVDCCGVLHHLADPAAGLAALAALLAPGGGMGLMLYAPYGRTGVYPLQSALRRLAGGLPAQERLALARKLVDGLPKTHWFARNPWLVDHKQSDAGLFDLLLHERDRPFAVGEIVALTAACGLAIAGFVPPLLYDPGLYLSDPRLKARLAGLDREARWALAEELAGNLKTHAFYVVRREDAGRAAAAPDDPRARPVLRDLDGPALAKGLRPGRPLTATLAGEKRSFPLPPLAGPMLARIDGRTDLAGLQAALAAGRSDLPWETFRRQFDQLYATLHGLGKMHLRLPAD